MSKYVYGRAPRILNRGSKRIGWSGPKNGMDVLSYRNGPKSANHHDIPGTSIKFGARPIRDGTVSGVVGGGSRTGKVDCECMS